MISGKAIPKSFAFSTLRSFNKSSRYESFNWRSIKAKIKDIQHDLQQTHDYGHKEKLLDKDNKQSPTDYSP